MMKKQVQKPTIALTVLVIFGLAFFFSMSKDQRGVYYGEVQSDSYDICTSVPGIIQEITVKEGDPVSEKTIVVKLNSDDAKLNQSKAVLAEETAKLQALKTASPARREELRIQHNTIKQLQEQKDTLNNSLAKAEITVSQSGLTIATLHETYQLKLDNFNNMERLYSEGFESKKSFDLAKMELSSAKNAYESAKLQLESIQKDNISLKSQMNSVDLQISSANEKLNMMELGLDSTDQQVAENASQMTQIDRQKSELMLSKYDIASSVDGIVESVNYYKGEFVNTGAPVISVVDKTSRHITIYIQETDLSKIKVGDKLDLSLASDESITVVGTVYKISEASMFTPMNIVTTKNRDRLVFPVDISLDASDAIAPGMLLKAALNGGK